LIEHIANAKVQTSPDFKKGRDALEEIFKTEVDEDARKMLFPSNERLKSTGV
jgi:hypothetical protein